MEANTLFRPLMVEIARKPWLSKPRRRQYALDGKFEPRIKDGCT